ncbi:hypothetical protein [Vibrio sp. Hal054]|uniref:hypothetical protein n=1 Tax=Vibrio sp. Hal054 TaxID=3035158 RepID=UPI00301CAC9B
MNQVNMVDTRKDTRFVVGSYSDFIAQEARKLVLDSLNNPTNQNLQENEFGHQINGLGVIANNNPFNNEQFSKRVEDIAKSCHQSLTDLAVNPVFNTPSSENIQKQVQWDLSNAVNMTLSSAMVDYTLKEGTPEINAPKFNELLAARVTEQIQQQNQLQNEIAVTMGGLVKLQEALMTSTQNPQFLERYQSELSNDTFNMPMLNAIKTDALKNDVAIPNEFETLMTAVDNLKSLGIDTENSQGVVMLQTTSKINSALTREGVDTSSIEFQTQVSRVLDKLVSRNEPKVEHSVNTDINAPH